MKDKLLEELYSVYKARWEEEMRWRLKELFRRAYNEGYRQGLKNGHSSNL